MFLKNIFPLVLICSLCFYSWAQESCEFKPTNKKGGHYLFSTFYEDDLQTPREGVCQITHLNQVYERRVFVNGRLIEETLNTFDGKPRVRSNFSLWDEDSILIDQKVYYENGVLQTHNIYYLDAFGRRSLKSIEFGLNGQKRFERSYAWIRFSELNESEKSQHPAHTIDQDGYTYLMVPIGAERIYSETGVLSELKFHQFISDGQYEHRSLHGPATSYYENGKIKSKGTYKDGSLNGVFRSFFPNGQLQSERYYQNDVPVGDWMGWHPNGKQAFWYLYDLESSHPFEPNKKEWAENGQLTLEQVLDIGANGYLKEWTENGLLIHQVDIKLLDRSKGVETWWYKDGQLHWRRDYRKGQDTSLVEFYPNGEWQRLEVFRDKGSESYKEIKRWYPQMILEQLFISETRPDGYFMQKEELYYPNGKLKSSVFYKNKECFKESFAINGTKTLSLHTILDSLHGPYQVMDSSGLVLLDYNYRSGLRHGWSREYDSEGKIVFEKYYQNGLPQLDFISLDYRKEPPKPSKETLQELNYLIKMQHIDSLLFKPNEIINLFVLAYVHFSELFEPLPKTESIGFRDFPEVSRVNLRKKDSLVWMDISTHPFGSISLIIYPDNEIEIFNQRLTKEELNNSKFFLPKYHMWQD